jgi:hypothetical protein
VLVLVGSTVTIGFSTRIALVSGEGIATRCVLCMPCGVSGEWCHAAVHRLPEWSRGVRAGFAWCWRCGQSSDGGLCTLDGAARAVGVLFAGMHGSLR